MAIVTQAYNTQRLILLQQVLLSDAEEGRPREYEIAVDDLKVVRRTADPERFPVHEDFVTPETRSVVITIYEGASRRNTRYFFTLKGTSVAADEENKDTLAGIEATVSEKLLEQKRAWEVQKLQEEITELKEEVEENETYIEELEGRLKDERERKASLKDNWGEVMSQALEGMVRRNTHLLSGIPMIGQGLAGVVEQDNKRLLDGSAPSSDTTTNQSIEGGASFQRRESEENKLQQYLLQLFSAFNREEQTQLLAMLEHFCQHKTHLVEVMSLLQGDVVGNEAGEGEDDTADLSKV